MPHQPIVLLRQHHLARRGRASSTFLITLAASLIGTVVVAVGAIVFSMASRSHSPQDELSEQVDFLFQSLADGRFGETYRTHTNLVLRESLSQEQYVDMGKYFFDTFGRLMSKEPAEFEMQTVAGVQGAYVSYNGTFEKGSATIQAEFRKGGPKWLLRSFNVVPLAEAKPAQSQ